MTVRAGSLFGSCGKIQCWLFSSGIRGYLFVKLFTLCYIYTLRLVVVAGASHLGLLRDSSFDDNYWTMNQHELSHETIRNTDPEPPVRPIQNTQHWITYSSPTSYDSPRTPDITLTHQTSIRNILRRPQKYIQPQWIIYHRCNLSHISTDFWKQTIIILSFNFIYLSARYNILVLIVNIVGIPTCSQHLLTSFVRRPDDGHISTETCSLHKK